MKNLVQYITFTIVLLLAFSCNDDFLTEERNAYGVISTIIISPDWEADQYMVYCEGAGNAKFTIKSTPDWLQVTSVSERFIDNVAVVNCKANVYGDFSEVGIYHSYMTLSIEGMGNKTVLVSYIVEGNPVIEIPSRLIMDNTHSIYYNGKLTVRNIGTGILIWDILELPQWLSVNPTSSYRPPTILPQNSEGEIYLSYNPESSFQENFSGKIVLATNDKNRPIVEVEVQMDMGSPSFYTWDFNLIDFGRTQTDRHYGFSNQAYGILVWKIEGCPEWLTVSESGGILHSYLSTTITFTCNRELMPPGANTVIIYLKTNDKSQPTYPITVTARSNIANTDNIKDLEGNITDAYLDRQMDILYFTTAQPSRFVTYDTKNRTIVRELSLHRAPTCFSLSEDGQKAVIGHSGYITSVDIDNSYNLSVTKTIEVNNIVHDIEWAKDGWCCYTENNVQWSYLYWVNLNTNETEKYYGLYEGCIVRKIPHQKYIAAVEMNLSSGVYIFDMDTREKKYEASISVGNFCFSENGTHLFSEKNIYRTNSLFGQFYNNPSPVGKFSPEPYRAFRINHHAASHSIWALSSFSDNYYGEQRIIIQYEDNDYTRKAIYYYDDVHNGRSVRAHYVFANKDGTELVVLRNTTSGDAMWSLEFIPIKE